MGNYHIEQSETNTQARFVREKGFLSVLLVIIPSYINDTVKLIIGFKVFDPFMPSPV
jgi:hypothetical protein